MWPTHKHIIPQSSFIMCATCISGCIPLLECLWMPYVGFLFTIISAHVGQLYCATWELVAFMHVNTEPWVEELCSKITGHQGPRWLSGQPVRLPPRRTGFNPRPGPFRIFACGNRAGRCRWSAGFFRGSPALSFRLCCTLTSITGIGSQDLAPHIYEAEKSRTGELAGTVVFIPPFLNPLLIASHALSRRTRGEAALLPVFTFTLAHVRDDRVSLFISLPGSQTGGITVERPYGLQEQGKLYILEKTRQPAASSGTIPTFENPGAIPPGIEPGSSWWEANALGHDGNTARLARRSDEALGVRANVASDSPSLLDLEHACGIDLHRHSPGLRQPRVDPTSKCRRTALAVLTASPPHTHGRDNCDVAFVSRHGEPTSIPYGYFGKQYHSSIPIRNNLQVIDLAIWEARGENRLVPSISRGNAQLVVRPQYGGSEEVRHQAGRSYDVSLLTEYRHVTAAVLLAKIVTHHDGQERHMAMFASRALKLGSDTSAAVPSVQLFRVQAAPVAKQPYSAPTSARLKLLYTDSFRPSFRFNLACALPSCIYHISQPKVTAIINGQEHVMFTHYTGTVTLHDGQGHELFTAKVERAETCHQLFATMRAMIWLWSSGGINAGEEMGRPRENLHSSAVPTTPTMKLRRPSCHTSDRRMFEQLTPLQESFKQNKIEECHLHTLLHGHESYSFLHSYPSPSHWPTPYRAHLLCSTVSAIGWSIIHGITEFILPQSINEY
ncbi:hypothetical protein PR048_017940 [Dryococelus australis]|uniref:Uncharacterized protein n=1 Tax=Dryococelus australis TaxID=614101 RepID=A0ABQ9HB12_9NEOP|nr:hypothetical protein PR048_017940 [Dryococelus australis]